MSRSFFTSLLAGAACLCLASAPLSAKSAAVTPTFNQRNAVKDTGGVHFSKKDISKFTAELGVGWNLGNALDATGGEGLESETSWGQPAVTKDMFHALAVSGIKTVRIPVSWHNHLIDSECTVDPAWMRRVKTVVDWALQEDLIVILNVHHDNAQKSPSGEGDGYYPNMNSKLTSMKFLANVWAQIALAFNNSYDYNLVFELLNEPRLAGTSHEWYFDDKDPDCLSSLGVIKEYNQLCLDTIRSSGGNNARRFVMVPSYAASVDASLSHLFSLPKDSKSGRLLLSVHMYTPEAFALTSPGESRLTKEHRRLIDEKLTFLRRKYVSKGVPVIVSECGATNKDNPNDRQEWYAHFFREAADNGMNCIMWDNGIPSAGPDGNTAECFGLFNRTDGIWYYPELLEAALQAVNGR